MLFLILIIVLPSLRAQSGFVQAYDLNETGQTFHNMLLVEDTIVICGKLLKEDYSQWGLFFCKMDTLGNVLDYKVHYDSLGDAYIFEEGYEMIKTSDGGYALVGQLFVRNYSILIKLDVNGELEFVREYPDDTVLNMQHWNIVEFEHGYISTGVKQQADDYKWDAFIMRTDKQGNKVWEISYGDYDLWDSFRGLKKITENEFLLTGGTGIGSTSVPTLFDTWKISKSIVIDSLGNILSEWEGELEYANCSRSSPTHLFADGQGNWVHEGGFIKIQNNFTSLSQGEIVKRNDNFDIIWSTRFGLPTSNRNNFIDLAQSPDGGWIAAGQYLEEIPSIPGHGSQGGWLAKVSAEGDSLWSRIDTIYSNNLETDAAHFLSGVVVLPSGSIIACGHISRFLPEPSKSLGWIIKVDKNGCMETDCNPLVDAINLTPLIKQIEIFPNPTSDYINIAAFAAFDWKLTDNNGKIIYEGNSITKSKIISLEDLKSGVYFLNLKIGNRNLTKKIIKV